MARIPFPAPAARRDGSDRNSNGPHPSSPAISDARKTAARRQRRPSSADRISGASLACRAPRDARIHRDMDTYGTLILPFPDRLLPGSSPVAAQCTRRMPAQRLCSATGPARKPLHPVDPVHTSTSSPRTESMHVPFVPSLSKDMGQHLRAGNGTTVFGLYTQAGKTT